MEAIEAAAEFHRIAWHVGFLSSGRVADWIDTELGMPEGERTLLERLAGGEPEEAVMQAALSRLDAVIGDEVSSEAVAYDLLGRMGKKVEWDPSLGPKTAAMIARLAEVAVLPEEQAVKLSLFQMRYAFPSVREAAVTDALLAYLQPYASSIGFV